MPLGVEHATRDVLAIDTVASEYNFDAVRR